MEIALKMQKKLTKISKTKNVKRHRPLQLPKRAAIRSSHCACGRVPRNTLLPAYERDEQAHVPRDNGALARTPSDRVRELAAADTAHGVRFDQLRGARLRRAQVAQSGGRRPRAASKKGQGRELAEGSGVRHRDSPRWSRG